jgi:nucleolar protein 15
MEGEKRTKKRYHLSEKRKDEEKESSELDTTSLKTFDEVENSSKTGTVVLSRIPHGFFEEQMREYFSQFGKVTKLRLSRNKKTGKSKHYAFIEFEHEEVAKIVAETMNGYLLFNHVLQCKLVDNIHPKLWNGANRKFREIPWKKIEVRKRNESLKSPEEKLARENKLLEKQEKLREKLNSLGIKYEFPGYQKE